MSTRLEVQKFLDSHDMDDLAQFSIQMIRSQVNPNLVLFKYDQIESPFSERIVQECRGLILDSADNWRVVSRSFDKFFNYGESLAAKIDWNNCRVYEKLDGSLCVLYYYKHSWHVQTSGNPDAAGKVLNPGQYNGTFAELFWSIYSSREYQYSLDLDQEINYIFELTSPHNRVVVPHEQSALTLIGLRDRETGLEHTTDYMMGFPKVRSFQLRSINDCIASFDKLNPLFNEGYVVCDKNFNRVKVKHPGYVAIHHMKGEFTYRRMLQLYLSGECEEFVSYYPEYKDRYEFIHARMLQLEEELKDAFQRYCSISSQKEFALAIKDIRCNGVLFQLRAKRINSIREGLRKIAPDSLLEHIKAGIQ